MTKHCVIVIGGELREPYPEIEADLVIAADSGWHHAMTLGLSPDILIGDFDSIDPSALADAKQRGVRVVEFPSDKDWTDFELSLFEAVKQEATSITVLAAWGGRMDHALTNIASFANPEMRNIRRRLIDGTTTLWVVDNQTITFTGEVGDVVSLLPFGGPVAAVSTTGLQYTNIEDHSISPFAAFGICDVMVDTVATVTAQNGTLLVIKPGD